jgi:hypothetical protein
MRVIWIDPGETVGWVTALVIAHPPALDGPKWDSRREPKVLEYGNTKLKTFALALLDGAEKYDLIGFETYRVRGGAEGARANVGSTVPTLQLVGMIRLAAWVAQRRRGDGLPKIAEREPLTKTGGRGAARLHAPPDIQDVIEEALAGQHDDGHYGDAMLHLYGWYHDTYHKDTP